VIYLRASDAAARRKTLREEAKTSALAGARALNPHHPACQCGYPARLPSPWCSRQCRDRARTIARRSGRCAVCLVVLPEHRRTVGALSCGPEHQAAKDARPGRRWDAAALESSRAATPSNTPCTPRGAP